MRKPKPKPKQTNQRARGPSKFRQSDIARAIRSVEAAGLQSRGIEIDPVTGKFKVLFGKPDEDDTNSWDKVLNAQDAKRAS